MLYAMNCHILTMSFNVRHNRMTNIRFVIKASRNELSVCFVYKCAPEEAGLSRSVKRGSVSCNYEVIRSWLTKIKCVSNVSHQCDRPVKQTLLWDYYKTLDVWTLIFSFNNESL